MHLQVAIDEAGDSVSQSGQRRAVDLAGVVCGHRQHGRGNGERAGNESEAVVGGGQGAFGRGDRVGAHVVYGRGYGGQSRGARHGGSRRISVDKAADGVGERGHGRGVDFAEAGRGNREYGRPDGERAAEKPEVVVGGRQCTQRRGDWIGADWGSRSGGCGQARRAGHGGCRRVTVDQAAEGARQRGKRRTVDAVEAACGEDQPRLGDGEGAVDEFEAVVGGGKRTQCRGDRVGADGGARSGRRIEGGGAGYSAGERIAVHETGNCVGERGQRRSIDLAQIACSYSERCRIDGERAGNKGERVVSRCERAGCGRNGVGASSGVGCCGSGNSCRSSDCMHLQVAVDEAGDGIAEARKRRAVDLAGVVCGHRQHGRGNGEYAGNESKAVVGGGQGSFGRGDGVGAHVISGRGHGGQSRSARHGRSSRVSVGKAADGICERRHGRGVDFAGARRGDREYCRPDGERAAEKPEVVVGGRQRTQRRGDWIGADGGSRGSGCGQVR